MHGRRGVVALAAVSGVSVVGSLAGCSVAPSMSAHALAEAQAAVRASHSTQAPTPHPVISLQPTPTPTATPTPSTAAAAVKKSPTPSPTPHSSTKPKPSPTPTPTPSATPTYKYTDGTYGARGSYVSPGGNETIRVNLTVANDLVTAVNVKSFYSNDSTAKKYEAMFESGISAVAVGKNLATLKVGAIGGSSLTCVGFNAAVVTIRTEAQK